MSRFNESLDNYKYLQLSSVVCDGDFFWAAAENYNAIYKVKKEDLSLEYICTVPEEEELGIELYASGVIKANNKIYLVPGSAKKIAIYDILNNSFKYITTDEMQDDAYPKFGVSSLIHQNIFLLPLEMQASYIIKINTETDTIEKIPFSINCDKTESRIDIFFFGCTVSEHIWFGTGQKQMIGRFKTESNEITYIRMNTTSSYVYSMFEQEGIIYMLTLANEVVSYNIETGNEKKLWCEDVKEETRYSRILWFENNLWLLPFSSDYIVKIKAPDYNEVEYIDLPSDLKKWKRWGVYGRKYYGYYFEQNKLCILPDNTNKVLKIESTNNTIEQYELLSNREDDLCDKFYKSELSREYYEDDLTYLIELLTYKGE